MIFVTGDTHISLDISKLNTENFPIQNNLTRDDYVVILGDFGLLWKNDKTYKHWKRWFEDKSFTTLFVDGNHENHDWIDSLPVSDWNQGKVHKVADNIIHLMRGEVYNIEGLNILAAGGAQSYDRAYRVEGISWWKRELWSHDEQNNAIENIEKVGKRVDYVFSHTCPSAVLKSVLVTPNYDPDPTIKILDSILDEIDKEYLKGWYFGHWHKNIHSGKFHCLYNEIVKLEV